MPGDALFAGRTAAWLHGLEVVACDPIEVTLPQHSTCSHLAGVSVTRSDYDIEEASEVRGLPVTSPIRTIADLARRGPFVESVVVLDMALRSSLVDREVLDSWIGSHRRYRGIGLLKRAIALADAGSESPMETRLRMLLVSDGLPAPAVQPTIRDEAGGFVARPDMCYLESRLALEYDGMTHRATLVEDNRRQNRLIDAGYRVLRFTAGDLLHRPASVTSQVRRALGYSSGSPN